MGRWSGTRQGGWRDPRLRAAALVTLVLVAASAVAVSTDAPSEPPPDSAPTSTSPPPSPPVQTPPANPELPEGAVWLAATSPLFLPGEPAADLEVVLVGELDPARQRLAVVVHNGSGVARYEVEVTAHALRPDGTLVGTGLPEASHPGRVASGGWALAIVYFPHPLPDPVELQLAATGRAGPTRSRTVDLAIVGIERPPAISNEPTRVEVANELPFAVGDPVMLTGACLHEGHLGPPVVAFRDAGGLGAGERAVLAAPPVGDCPDLLLAATAWRG